MTLSNFLILGIYFLISFPYMFVYEWQGGWKHFLRTALLYALAAALLTQLILRVTGLHTIYNHLTFWQQAANWAAHFIGIIAGGVVKLYWPKPRHKRSPRR